MDADADKPLPDATSVRVAVGGAVGSVAVALWLTIEAVCGVAQIDFALVVNVVGFLLAAWLFGRTKRHGIDGTAVAPLLLATPALNSSRFSAGATFPFIAALALAVVAMALHYRTEAAHAAVSEAKRKQLEKSVRRSRRTLPWFASVAFATAVTWLVVRPKLTNGLWIVFLVIELLSALPSLLDAVYVFYVAEALDRLAAAGPEPAAKAS